MDARRARRAGEVVTNYPPLLKRDRNAPRCCAGLARALLRPQRSAPLRSGVGDTMNEEDLRATVRALLQSRALPGRRPDRTWGRPGRDLACSVCTLPIGRADIELEVHFALDVYQVHTECFAVWQREADRERG